MVRAIGDEGERIIEGKEWKNGGREGESARE